MVAPLALASAAHGDEEAIAAAAEALASGEIGLELEFMREVGSSGHSELQDALRRGSSWVEEELEPGLRVSYGLKEVLASTKSKWQHVDLVDLQPFGRVLMIDGLVQSCQAS